MDSRFLGSRVGVHTRRILWRVGELILFPSETRRAQIAAEAGCVEVLVSPSALAIRLRPPDTRPDYIGAILVVLDAPHHVN